MADVVNRIRTLVVVFALVAALGVLAYYAFATYMDHVRPRDLRVENRTDHPIAIQVGTSYHLEVAPHSSGAIHTGWFPASGDVELTAPNPLDGAVLCNFSDAVGHPLVISADHADCGQSVFALGAESQ